MNMNASRMAHRWLLFLLVAGLMAGTRVVHAQILSHPPLCTFTGNNGSKPNASLIQGRDGNLYGTTSSGGVNNEGTVFKITPAGTLTTLYSFGSATGDGSAPLAALTQGQDGNFYGTTSSGGVNNEGTVFKITPAGTLTVLHSFSALSSVNTNADGTAPLAALILDTDGNFRGTTSSGGKGGCGTVYKLTPSGMLTTLHSFSAISPAGTNTDGASPEACLLQGSGNSNLYGTTYTGGASGYGTIFKLTSSGTLTTLYSFSGYHSSLRSTSDGANPHAGLIQGKDGNFYGTTSSGGVNNEGTIFKMTLSGAVTILYSFSALSNNTNADGASPLAGVIQAKDGNLYGTTYAGGTSGYGTIFSLAPSSGTLSSLFSFYGYYGENPLAGVCQGNNGNFYGTTSASGFTPSGSAVGTVFRLRMAPAFTSVSPLPLPPAGSTVSLRGSFPEATLVTVGSTQVTAFTVNPDSSLTFTMPASASSGVISVYNPFGKATFGTPTQMLTSNLARGRYQVPAGGGIEPVYATIENTQSQEIYLAGYTCTLSNKDWQFSDADPNNTGQPLLGGNILLFTNQGYPGLPIAPNSVGFTGLLGTFSGGGGGPTTPLTRQDLCTVHLYGYVGSNLSDEVDLGHFTFAANPYLPITSDINNRVFHYSAAKNKGFLTIGGKIWNSYNYAYQAVPGEIPASPTLGYVSISLPNTMVANSQLAKAIAAKAYPLPYGTVLDFTSGMYTLSIPAGTASFTATIFFGDWNVENVVAGLVTFTVDVGP